MILKQIYYSTSIFAMAQNNYTSRSALAFESCHRIREYAEMEGTHNDYQTHLLALHSTTPRLTSCLRAQFCALNA